MAQRCDKLSEEKDFVSTKDMEFLMKRAECLKQNYLHEQSVRETLIDYHSFYAHIRSISDERIDWISKDWIRIKRIPLSLSD